MSSASQGLRVSEHAGIDGLDALERPWRELVDALPDAEYFQDFDWFRLFCRHAFPDPSVLRFLSVEDPLGRTRAILSLESRIERIRRVPCRIWAMVGSRENDVLLMAPSADILCGSVIEGTAALRICAAYLAGASPRAGMLLLGRVTGESYAWRASQPLARGGRLDFARGGFNVIDTSRTIEELETVLSRDFLRKLRRRRRALEREGKVEFEVIRAADAGFSAAYEAFLDIEASGWKGENGERSALRFKPVQRTFLEDIAESRGEVGAQVHLLRVNGIGIAAEFWLRYRSMMVRLKIGYHENFRSFGLGNQMMHEALRMACADEKISKINRVSNQPWHKDWGGGQFRARRWRYLPLANMSSVVPSLLLRLPALKDLRGGGARAT